MKIKHPNKGIIDFIPYKHQQELFDYLDAGHNVLLMGSRQTGATTAILIYILNDCIKNQKTVNYFTTSRSAAADECKRLFNIISLYDSSIVESRTKFKIVLSNGSVIYFTSYNSDHCSMNYEGDVYFDNAEFIKSDVIQTLNAALNRTNIRLFENGKMQNFTDNFITITWLYSSIVGRDDKWKEEMITILGGVKQFNHEYYS